MLRAIQAGERFQRQDERILITHDFDRCYQWLADRQLLYPRRFGGRVCNLVGCNGWQTAMYFYNDESRADGGRYQCQGDPNHKINIRQGCRAPLPLLTRVLFHHFLSRSSITAASLDTGLHQSTISQIYNFVRFAIHQAEIADRAFHPVGLVAIVERENDQIWQRLDNDENLNNRRYFYHSPSCEMDEMLATHILGEQVWIIGIWDRREHRAVVHVAGNDRSAENVNFIINSYCRTRNEIGHPFYRTRIYHDGWRGYDFLHQPESAYEGFRVIHEGPGRFGHDINSTNRIEGFWADLRREANFSRGYHYQNIREVQIEADVANWRIQNRQNDLWEELANILLRMTLRGGGIGACIRNISTIESELQNDDVNDDIDIEALALLE